MLWLLVVFILQVFLLTQLKKEMVTLLWKFSHAVTGSAHLGVWIYALVFFPGTLLHELSHLLTAEILRVKTSDIVLLPKIQNGFVTLGYVRVAKADPFRSLLIGTAPFLTGLVLLAGIVYFFFQPILPTVFSLGILWQSVVPLFHDLRFWLALYAIIVVSHSMFLSESDKGEVYIIPIAAVGIGAVIYFTRYTVSIPAVVNHFIVSVLLLLTITFSVVLLFNLAFVFLLYLIKALFGKLF